MTDKPFDTSFWSNQLGELSMNLPREGVEDPTAPGPILNKPDDLRLAIQLPNDQALPIANNTLEHAIQLIAAMAQEVIEESHGMPTEAAGIWSRQDKSTKLLAAYLTLYQVPNVMNWQTRQEYEIHIDAAIAFLRESVMPKLFANAEHVPVAQLRGYAQIFVLAGRIYDFLSHCPVIE